jgi:hypothetical protein
MWITTGRSMCVGSALHATASDTGRPPEMDPLDYLLREINELSGIPVVTDRLIRDLAEEGRRLIHEEAMEIERRLEQD